MDLGVHSRSPVREAGHILEGYAPAGIDEMLDADGSLRPIWRKLVEAFDRIGAGDLRKRFARADQYLRDAGVYYRVYGRNENEREWPLAHVPLLISEAEWSEIDRGLCQRAELLERVVADIYGENDLVRRGLLPAQLIGSNPEFLRPVAGFRPPGGHFLHFCAFDLGRGPDGRWWVLGDRTQAPSGAGFSLENRVATTRALPDIFAEMNVHRLAGFFRRFRDSLENLAIANDGRAAILTPGPHNETYFEHAYIARYLGIMLLEGGDLTMSGGRLMVRTVSGLMPLGVIWRRMDAAFTDPLEFRGDSRIGTPGFAESVRNGSPALVNALGTGILETRAMLAFLPALSRDLLGEELVLSNIATWWCGDTSAAARVADGLDRLMIGPALSSRLPFEDPESTRLGSSLTPTERAELMARLARAAPDLVGQEAVDLSTTPVFVNGHFEPRPASLRVYVARTADGWTVMPGGFARVGLGSDLSAIAMQRGGLAADVWVVADDAVPKETLLPDDTARFTRGVPGSLPSRAAENLVWLGRYIERSEAVVRLLRARHARLAEASGSDRPLLALVDSYLQEIGHDAAEPVPASLLSTVDGAMGSAGQIRDRFSPDGWMALRDLSLTLHRFHGTIGAGDDAARAMTIILRKLAGFSGLVHENMYRFTGWRFLEIGRRLERGIQMAQILAWLARPKPVEGALELLLEVGDSVMTHRRQYSVSSGRLTVVDLLALDSMNPRSVLFQVDSLDTEIGLLPKSTSSGHHRTQAEKAIMKIRTGLAVLDPAEATPEALEKVAQDLASLYLILARAYFA